MTKQEMMIKIADYRKEYENYDMGYMMTEYYAKKLPKWVLEELLKQCDHKHCIVMFKEKVYTYWHDTYKHDFEYYVKLKKGFKWDTTKQVYYTI